MSYSVKNMLACRSHANCIRSIDTSDLEAFKVQEQRHKLKKRRRSGLPSDLLAEVQPHNTTMFILGTKEA